MVTYHAENPLKWVYTNYGKSRRQCEALREGRGHWRAQNGEEHYRIDMPMESLGNPTATMWTYEWRVSYYDFRPGRPNPNHDRTEPTLAEAKEACRIHTVSGRWEPKETARNYK